MGGFIGSTEDGVTTTLGRGGSDFTASIVGAGIGAEEIQIWTDVDGMLTADPTILPGGHRVKTISFAEAAELAYFGAKVLHPATVVPAIEKNIPVLILNSRRPEVPGTRIVSEAVPCEQRGQVHRLQAQDHAGQHSLHPHADGARLPAPHLRSLRPLRNARGHGGHLRGQRLAHHRQHRRASTQILAELRAVRRGRHRERPGDRLPGGREHPLHSGRGAPRLQRARRHQHPHDFAGRVAAQPQLRRGRSRPAAQPSRRCTTSSSPSSIPRSSSAARPSMPETAASPLSATARWAG